ncbi:MAG TPA: sugar ABC transporter permease [Symbiobacteriaceae bacterium]|jgi:sn-glycerol 3-phosphate transport system permease protein
MAQPSLAAAPPGTPVKRKAPRFNWGPYLLLLPSAVLLSVFTLYPMAASGVMALFKANMAFPEPVWNGLGNFKALFAQEIFRKTMWNTVVFAVGTIPFSVGLALFLAVQLNRKLRGTALVRAAFFYPTMLPLVSAASIWNFMYNPMYGPISLLIKFFGGTSPNFLGEPGWALPAIMFVSIWKDAGYFMIFYLAGLQSLPGDVFEAAELDGASGWQQFVRITFPLLTPTTLFVATISFINAFKTVDQIFVMTQGGPQNATSLLLYYIWQQTFAYFDKGMGAAASVVLIAILLAAALFNHLYVDKRVHYE